MNTLKLLKNGLLNLEYLSALDFDALQQKLKNEQYVISVNTFLSRLFQLYNCELGINTATTKIFLSAYVIMSHREVVTSNDTYAVKLGNNATDMLLRLETLFTNTITLKDYNKFMNSFNRYVAFFKVWRERDSLLMARPVINSYFNTEMMVEQMQDSLVKNDKLTSEQKDLTADRIKDLKRVLLKLKQNIRIIAGNKGLSFLESREMPYFKDEDVFQSVEQTVRKAFWDVVTANFEDEKYDQMITLLDDLKSMMVELVPNTSFVTEIDQVIDTEHLTTMISHGLLTNEAIKLYINFIIGQIVKLQPASEDTNTQLFKENIESMFNNGEKRSTVLAYFFENAFNKMEKIKAVTLRIRAQLNEQ